MVPVASGDGGGRCLQHHRCAAAVGSVGRGGAAVGAEGSCGAARESADAFCDVGWSSSPGDRSCVEVHAVGGGCVGATGGSGGGAGDGGAGVTVRPRAGSAVPGASAAARGDGACAAAWQSPHGAGRRVGGPAAARGVSSVPSGEGGRGFSSGAVGPVRGLRVMAACDAVGVATGGGDGVLARAACGSAGGDHAAGGPVATRGDGLPGRPCRAAGAGGGDGGSGSAGPVAGRDAVHGAAGWLCGPAAPCGRGRGCGDRHGGCGPWPCRAGVGGGVLREHAGAAASGSGGDGVHVAAGGDTIDGAVGARSPGGAVRGGGGGGEAGAQPAPRAAGAGDVGAAEPGGCGAGAGARWRSDIAVRDRAGDIAVRASGGPEGDVRGPCRDAVVCERAVRPVERGAPCGAVLPSAVGDRVVTGDGGACAAGSEGVGADGGCVWVQRDGGGLSAGPDGGGSVRGAGRAHARRGCGGGWRAAGQLRGAGVGVASAGAVSARSGHRSGDGGGRVRGPFGGADRGVAGGVPGGRRLPAAGPRVSGGASGLHAGGRVSAGGGDDEGPRGASGGGTGRTAVPGGDAGQRGSGDRGAVRWAGRGGGARVGAGPR